MNPARTRHCNRGAADSATVSSDGKAPAQGNDPEVRRPASTALYEEHGLFAKEGRVAMASSRVVAVKLFALFALFVACAAAGIALGAVALSPAAIAGALAPSVTRRLLRRRSSGISDCPACSSARASAPALASPARCCRCFFAIRSVDPYISGVSAGAALAAAVGIHGRRLVRSDSRACVRGRTRVRVRRRDDRRARRRSRQSPSRARRRRDLGLVRGRDHAAAPARRRNRRALGARAGSPAASADADGRNSRGSSATSPSDLPAQRSS